MKRTNSNLSQQLYNYIPLPRYVVYCVSFCESAISCIFVKTYQRITTKCLFNQITTYNNENNNCVRP